MSEIKSPVLYRQFQKFALLVGIILTIAGYVMMETFPVLLAVGATVLFHGLIATIILMVEDLRTSRKSSGVPSQD